MKNKKLQAQKTNSETALANPNLDLKMVKIGIPDKVILKAYNDAIDSGQRFALKALICGQLLNEKRVELAPVSGNRTTGQFLPKNGSDFNSWLKGNFPGKSRTTLYTWMSAAERVVKTQLQIGVKEKPPTIIDVEGETLPISRAFLAPAKELPPVAQELRENVFTFMQDKSIKDAMAIRLEGEGKKRARRAKSDATLSVAEPVKATEGPVDLTTCATEYFKAIGVHAAVAPDETRDVQGYLDHAKLMEMAGKLAVGMAAWPFWFMRVMGHAVDRARKPHP